MAINAGLLHKVITIEILGWIYKLGIERPFPFVIRERSQKNKTLLWLCQIEKTCLFRFRSCHNKDGERQILESFSRKLLKCVNTSSGLDFSNLIKIWKKCKKLLRLDIRCGKILEYDCDRYALKREVALVSVVFPWSMSDFKPGDEFKKTGTMREELSKA